MHFLNDPRYVYEFYWEAKAEQYCDLCMSLHGLSMRYDQWCMSVMPGFHVGCFCNLKLGHRHNAVEYYANLTDNTLPLLKHLTPNRIRVLRRLTRDFTMFNRRILELPGSTIGPEHIIPYQDEISPDDPFAGRYGNRYDPATRKTKTVFWRKRKKK